MTTLHEAGWRQGSMLTGPLETMRLGLGTTGHPQRIDETFDRWIVSSQDCDLAAEPVDGTGATIELRPLTSSNGAPPEWGVRNRVFAIDADYVTDARAPRQLVSPALLQSLASNRLNALSDARARAFKTWLGLRYDRPAVPAHLVDAARDVAKRCGSKGGREAGEQVHDVLMQFNETTNPPQVAILAVIAEEADRGQVTQWLAEAATRIRTDLCVVALIDVGTRSETSLELLETSYAADLSQLTWQVAEPTGAE